MAFNVEKERWGFEFADCGCDGLLDVPIRGHGGIWIFDCPFESKIACVHQTLRVGVKSESCRKRNTIEVAYLNHKPK